MTRGVGNNDVGAVLQQVVEISNVFARGCHAVTFRVSRRPREMYCGHARLSVCVSVSVRLCVGGRCVDAETVLLRSQGR